VGLREETMRLGELIKTLQGLESRYSADQEIYFAGDEEGNTIMDEANIEMTEMMYEDETALVLYPSGTDKANESKGDLLKDLHKAEHKPQQEQKKVDELKLPEIDKLEYSEIWKLGNRMSGGYGFWGSSQLLDANNPKEMVKAWVDALRELGYSDLDIILYGDWKDGRHIADNITSSTTYEQFKQIVRDQADKDVEKVAGVNKEDYRDNPKVKDVLRYMGKEEYDLPPREGEAGYGEEEPQEEEQGEYGEE
jgi:hypothetical protein